MSCNSRTESWNNSSREYPITYLLPGDINKFPLGINMNTPSGACQYSFYVVFRFSRAFSTSLLCDIRDNAVDFLTFPWASLSVSAIEWNVSEFLYHK